MDKEKRSALADRVIKEQEPSLLPAFLECMEAGLVLTGCGDLEKPRDANGMGGHIAFVQRDDRGKPRLITRVGTDCKNH